MPLTHAQLACGGMGPLVEQSALPVPSSVLPLQLSSMPLHTSAMGVLAVQPFHMELGPSQVSMPLQVPAALEMMQACVTPSRLALHGHEAPSSGTHHRMGLLGMPASTMPPASGLPASAPPSAPASGAS